MATNNIKIVINATDNSSAALKALANNINNIKKGVTSLTNDTNSATSQLSTMNTSLSSSPGLFSRLASGAKKALTIFGGYKLISGVFNSISGSISGAFERLDTMDLFERKMKILTGDANAATYALNEMKTATKGTAYGLGTAAKAVQNFVTRGMSTQQATESVKTWMDAVAVYGNGTNEALESVINALGKMRSKGTVEMRHINSMINAGINPVQLYAQATGQAAADVQTQLSEKTLRTEEFLNVVENALRTGAGGVAKVTGMAKDMATTWQATFDNMRFALNRGWAALIDGADSLLRAFSDDGLKGVFKNFGVYSENLFNGIGNTLNRAGQTIRDFYADFIQRHKEAGKITAQTDLINYNTRTNIMPDTGEKLKNSFLGELGNYAEPMAAGFITLANSWAKFQSAVAQGVNQIAPQLGQLFGIVFGEGVTNATDLLNAFLNWATLKLPEFFNWVQVKLQWIIDHKDQVISMATSVLKAFLAWQALKSVQNVIVGFNSKLEALNNTLGFFTGGRIQLPTLNNSGSFFGISEMFKSSLSVNEVTGEVERVPGVFQRVMGRTSEIVSSEGSKIKSSLRDIGSSISSLGSKRKGKAESGFSPYETVSDRGFTEKQSSRPPLEYFTDFEVMGDESSAFDNIESSAKRATSALDGLNTKSLTTSSSLKMLNPPAIESGNSLATVGERSLSAANNLNQTGYYAGQARDCLEGFEVVGNEMSVLDDVGNYAVNASGGLNGLAQASGPAAMGMNALAPATAASETAGTGLISTIGSLVSSLLSIGAVVVLAVAAIGALAMGLGVFNPGNQLSNAINSFFENFNKKVLEFGEYASVMISNFVNGIISRADQLREQGVNLVLSLVTGLLTAIPNLLATGIRIVGSLIAGIIQVLPTLVYQGFMAIGQFIAGIISAIPNVLQGIGNMLMAMAEFILTNGPMFVESGVKLIANIILGIINMANQVRDSIRQLLENTWNWIISGDALKMFQDVGKKLVDWMLVGLAKTSWGKVVLGWFGQDADAILQNAETDGAKTGESFSNNLQNKMDTSTIDLTSIWNNANIEQNNATATEMGLNAAGALVNAEQNTLDMADINTDILGDSAAESIESAGVAGTDLGESYTTNAADTINLGAAQVGEAANAVSSQLNLTFDSEAVRASATDFINTVAVVFTEQAPLLYQTAGNIGKGVVNEFTAKVNENLQMAYATGVGLMSMFKMGIDEAFNSVRQAINLGIQTILISFRDLPQTFYMYGSHAALRYGQGFSDTAPTATQKAREFKILVLEELRGISEASYSIGSSTLRAFHNGVVSMQATVVEDFVTLAKRISTNLTSEMNTLTSNMNRMTRDLMNSIHRTMSSGLDSCVRLVAQKRNEIEMAFHPIINSFGLMGAQMMTNLALGMQSRVGEVVDMASSLVQRVKSTFQQELQIQSPSGYMTWIGQMMVEGLSNGINSDEIQGYVTNVVGSMQSSFEEGLGIHSPSDYMIWVGQMMIQGLIDGLNPDRVQGFITNIINDVQTSFASGNIKAAETMEYLSQDGALNLMAKVIGMDLSAIENTNASIPAIIQAAEQEVTGSGSYSNSKVKTASGRNMGFIRSMAEKEGLLYPTTNYVPNLVSWSQPNGQWTMQPQTGYGSAFGSASLDGIHTNTWNGASRQASLGEGRGMVTTLLSTLQNVYREKYNPGAFRGAVEGGNVNWTSDAGANRWESVVQQALQMTGQPLSYTNAMLHAIQRESGGDPNSTNNWNNNAATGQNSRGLMQLIPDTFRKYAMPGLSPNIYDPLSNVVAAIRYILGRYGSIPAMVNPRMTSDNGWYGYAVGTRYVPQDMMAMIHEGEAIIPASVNPYSNSGGDYLGDLVRSMFAQNSGIEGDTSGVVGATYNDNSQNIVIQAPITLNLENGDSEEIAINISEELHKALTRAIAVGNAR